MPWGNLFQPTIITIIPNIVTPVIVGILKAIHYRPSTSHCPAELLVQKHHRKYNISVRNGIPEFIALFVSTFFWLGGT